MGDDALPREDRGFARWAAQVAAAARTAEQGQRLGIAAEQTAGLHDSYAAFGSDLETLRLRIGSAGICANLLVSSR